MALTGKYAPCPRCREEGADSKGNHLNLFDDGMGGWCARTHGKVLFDEDEPKPNGGQRINYQKTTRDEAQEMSRISTYSCRAYPERKISKETMEFFGVKAAVSMEDGHTITDLFEPSFDDHGEIEGYKCRSLPKTFSVVGKVRNFFGWNKVNGRNFIILVEGGQDAMAAHEIMKELKPDRPPYNVVSVPNGANEEKADGTVPLDSTLKKLLPKLAEFQKVVLCLDMDGPGKATAGLIADYLCSSTDVRIATLPLKDTAALWEAGRATEWGQAINNARKYVSDQIVLGSEGMEELDEPLQEGLRFDFIPKTCDKIHGFRLQEMNTLIGPPNHGKSSLYRQIMYESLLATDEPIGGFFLEELTKKTKQSMIAYHCDVPLNQFRANPMRVDSSKKEEAKELLLPRLHLFDHKRQTMTDDLVLRKIEYMVKALGCRRVFFDHLTFVVSAMDVKDERRAIDVLLTKLARSVEDWDYSLFIVAHINRGGKEHSKQSKEEKYPYWETLSMQDARGSGSIEQLSHNMFALERQVLDPNLNDTRGLSRIRCLRSREWGGIGLCDTLTMDYTGKFVPVPEPTF